ncbi:MULTISPECIES: type II toxin-antitoxin system RelE/ParE family toxin [unclassified Rhizobium]|uniref:type II toxin-antitoxin system RelE/ParE family toxin n=1 Tax=unclassified Rhizobium TaxID=2613769 RepID=UPI0007136DF7|nr:MULTISPECIES: type II toxin-antitoxin system RelE/ParE family toxin [unclassified Rhizobium]KQS96353.1 plasmid stabilization protein [Rhizobium sp. Leaf386]KQT06192.1 plasmid stabilization protein [Rhizobium sp. Leaf391]KQU09573.1 plasmid stabilization protein [Rhizobium sp. Leaf453]
MTYTIRYTNEALEDFDRLYDYLVVFDVALADRAYEALQQAIKLLESFPFSCRKVSTENALLRELVVPFGGSGYVVLFRIDSNDVVTVAAVRHQREDDYH